MNTLQELVEADFGLGSEKTAGVADQHELAGNDGLAKLAAELSLDAPEADFVPEAAYEGGSEKIAAAGEFTGLYDQVFPEDAASEKYASAEQQGEEFLGALAYDAFSRHFDARIEKMAMETMSGSATVDAAEAHIGDGNPHGDSRPDQTQPGNRPANAESAINTSPSVENLLPPQKGDHVSGAEQTGEDATQKTAAAYAFQKHMLLAGLEG